MKHSKPRSPSGHSFSSAHGKSRGFNKSSGFSASHGKRFYDAKPKKECLDDTDAGRDERHSAAPTKSYDKKFSGRDGFTDKKPFRSNVKHDRNKSRDDDRRGARSERKLDAPAKFYEKKFPARDGFKGKKTFRNDKNSFRPNSKRDHKPAPVVDKVAADHDLIWGLHAARAAWLNPNRRCFRLWLTESGRESFALTLAEAEQNLLARPTPKNVDRSELDQITPPGSVHQGIVLEAYPLPEPTLKDLISGDNPPDILLMLDQVTDPHNVGAILRSAAAFGARAVIMTERNAPNMTGVLAKSASGAVEHVPQIHVVNLSRTLDELQQAGYWCVGLAEEGKQDLAALDLSGRMVLVMGAEGDGLRQLTRKKCDELARLPTGGAIGSLNVSNAAAIALYEIRRQKSKFIK